MTRSGSRQLAFIIGVAFCGLVAAALACSSSNMRAPDEPVWMCPTATLDPDCFVTASPLGVEAGTPLPQIDGLCSFESPYILHDDFRLGRNVIVGAVGGSGMGLWVSMDHVQVSGPFDYTYTPPGLTPAAGGLESFTRQVWVVSWDITMTNGSLTNDYEFYPQLQAYVIDIEDQQGNELRGAWPVSAEAHDLIGLEHLGFEGDTYLAHGKPEPMSPYSFTPGAGHTYRVAAIIPTAKVRRFALILDPLDTEKVGEMVQKNSLGSNVALWVNEHEKACRYGDIIPQSGQFSSAFVPGGPPQPGVYVDGYLLARHPLNAYHIVRGFGCASQWTGFKSSACPGEGWFHNGVDYGAVSGTTYYDTLPVAGTLLYAGPDDAPDCSYLSGSQAPHAGYGNFVKQAASEQGHSLVLWGGHLSAISAAGDETTPGQVLGAVGSTGCSTGPHLHFAVSVDGRFVDPEALIPPGQ